MSPSIQKHASEEEVAVSPSTSSAFKAAEVGRRIDSAVGEVGQLLRAAGGDEEAHLLARLEHEIEAHRERGVLCVAFVGQYSAGKSTIISALTGRRDIEIDTDIATFDTATFEWCGLNLVDTPGLWTDRDDHDEITYDAIRNADLLVFCLTSQLFDDITVRNFRKLAWEMGYHRKMMLTINKMSDEPGERDALIEAYRDSLNQALRPNTIDEFLVAFIDAKDHCDGIDDDDAELRKESFFKSFIDQLNAFVEDRELLARTDTPIRILVGAIDDAIALFARDGNEDDAFLLLLNQINRRVRNERTRLRNMVRGVALDLSTKIADIGAQLALELGKNMDFEGLCNKKETEVEHICRTHAEKLGPIAAESAAAVEREVSAVLDSELARQFAANINPDGRPDVDDPGSREIFKKRMERWSKFQKIGGQVGAMVAKTAEGAKVGTGAGAGILKTGQVAGGQLHTVIYGIGKVLGANFKPWQAVNIAKGIGNVARVMGPTLAVVGIALDIVDAVGEEKNAQMVSNARRELAGQFLAIAQESEAQIDRFLRKEVEPHIFGDVNDQLEDARRDHQQLVADADARVGHLQRLRNRMMDLIQEITKS